MTDEPYRWVEAIANRREYIETQLAPGKPIVAISFAGGILLVSPAGVRQKVFEIYDRIALGAVGHPGDIERLRMAAIEMASTEGFTRSAADVSLRRLAHYSLSPVLKSAFEHVYGAPFLARLLFAELGRTQADDLLLQLEFDGAIEAAAGEHFAVISGTRESRTTIESHLREHAGGAANLRDALAAAVGALHVGANGDSEAADASQFEAALLDRDIPHAVKYRVVTTAEIADAAGTPH